MHRPNEPIDGIYNYCDRWCERCSMTTRCRLFSVEQECEAREALGQDELRAFWEAMHSVFSREFGDWDSGDAYDEEPAPELETSVSWTDSEGFGEFERVMAHQPDPHPLVRAADDYRRAVERWHARFDGLAAERTCAVVDGVGVEEALDVTRWYQYQILFKLSRAVRREPWNDEEIDDLIAASVDGEPYAGQTLSDSDGSAKVAILGIERSFAAWSVLRGAVHEAADVTFDLMRRLMRLRLAVDEEFPGARSFKRPGFDEN